MLYSIQNVIWPTQSNSRNDLVLSLSSTWWFHCSPLETMSQIER